MEPRDMKSQRRRAALILVLIFLTGVFTGGGLLIAIGPPPPGAPPGLGPLDSLELTPDQQTQAEQLHEKYRPELEEILRGTYPKVREIQVKIETELEAILTPEQRERFDELRSRRPPPPLPGFGPGGDEPQ